MSETQFDLFDHQALYAMQDGVVRARALARREVRIRLEVQLYEASLPGWLRGLTWLPDAGEDGGDDGHPGC